MPVRGLDRDAERAGDLLGLKTAGEHADDLGLAVGQPRRALDPRRPLARRLDDGRHRVGVESSGAGFLAQDLRRSFGRDRLPVRTRLGHRVEGVGGREQACGKRKLRAAGAAVVAGAVEALVVGSGNGRQLRQELRAREHPLGVVGMEPHLLPLIRGQRSGLLPDPRACDRHAPEVVDERGASKGSDAGLVDPAAPRRRCGELRHRRRSDPPDTARSGRRSCPSRRARDRARSPSSTSGGPRLAGERLVPRRRPLVEARISPALSTRQAATSGSNACPARSRTRRTTRSSPPSRRWKAASTARWTIRIGSGISSPFARPSGPWPSQRSNRWARRPCTDARQPQPVGEHPGHLAGGGEVRARLPRHPRQPAGDLTRAHQAAAVRVGKRAQQPGQDLAPRPVA